jgi:hypothetical protein
VRRHPLLAKVGILVSSPFAASHLWLLGVVLYGIDHPRPDSFCATGEVGVLVLAAVCIAPVSLALAAAHPFFRRQIPSPRIWRTTAIVNAIALVVAATINWLALARFLPW